MPTTYVEIQNEAQAARAAWDSCSTLLDELGLDQETVSPVLGRSLKEHDHRVLSAIEYVGSLEAADESHGQLVSDAQLSRVLAALRALRKQTNKVASDLRQLPDWGGLTGFDLSNLLVTAKNGQNLKLNPLANTKNSVDDLLEALALIHPSLTTRGGVDLTDRASQFRTLVRDAQRMLKEAESSTSKIRSIVNSMENSRQELHEAVKSSQSAQNELKHRFSQGGKRQMNITPRGYPLRWGTPYI